jgi:hypothetical protein
MTLFLLMNASDVFAECCARRFSHFIVQVLFQVIEPLFNGMANESVVILLKFLVAAYCRYPHFMNYLYFETPAYTVGFSKYVLRPESFGTI